MKPDDLDLLVHSKKADQLSSYALEDLLMCNRPSGSTGPRPLRHVTLVGGRDCSLHAQDWHIQKFVPAVWLDADAGLGSVHSQCHTPEGLNSDPHCTLICTVGSIL